MDIDIDNSIYAKKAMDLFLEGYNCSQSVFLAFSDLYDMDRKTALKLSSSFGGGMGKLREVCGTVSGMFMVAGMLYGYDSPTDHTGKTIHYKRIQELAEEFRSQNNSIVCRELLGLNVKKQNPEPEKRSAEYYKKRPCARLAGMSAAIMEEYIKEHTLKITTLIENHTDDEKELTAEHGLSMFVEYDGMKILFDTGQTDTFIENARNLKVPIEQADCVVLSHGHYDHTGGLMKYINMYGERNVYVGQGFFREKYKKTSDGEMKYIGIPITKDFIEEENSILHEIHDDTYKISDNIYLCRNFKSVNDYEKLNKKFVLKNDKDEYYIDGFTDEQALVIRTGNGLVVIAGCSHVGIINILSQIQERFTEPIKYVIGGTHLVNTSDERLAYTIEELEKMNLDMLAVSHCTGDENIEKLKNTFNNTFFMNVCGSRIVIR